MSKIELKTDQKHRFSRSIIINGTEVFINGQGHASVEEELVTYALESGFELVDPTVKFKSKEEDTKVKEVAEILTSARKQAEAIIKEAEEKALKIVAAAEEKAQSALDGGKTEAIVEMRTKLELKKVSELKEVLIASGVEVTSIETLKKAELINMIVDLLQNSN